MDINQILLMIILALLTILIVVGAYLAIINIKKKKQEKKENIKFDNMDFKETNVLNDMEEIKKEKNTIQPKIKSTKIEEEKKVDNSPINPFGINLEPRTDQRKLDPIIEEENNNNKFFK